MNAAIQKFETVGFLRGGRISGFLDRQRTPFYLTKKLMEVAHIDEQGRAVRVPQWIIDLEAPVDVTALLRENEDTETALVQAQLATQVLQGSPAAASAESLQAGCRRCQGDDGGRRGIRRGAAVARRPSQLRATDGPRAGLRDRAGTVPGLRRPALGPGLEDQPERPRPGLE
jgi:hypothetical protein